MTETTISSYTHHVFYREHDSDDWIWDSSYTTNEGARAGAWTTLGRVSDHGRAKCAPMERVRVLFAPTVAMALRALNS